MAKDSLGGIRPFPLSDHQIKLQADEVARACIPRVGIAVVGRSGMSFDAVYEEYIYPEFGVILVERDDLRDVDGTKIHGRYNPFSNTAFINRSLKGDPRLAFTRWHEVVGHGVLQGKWLRDELLRLGVNDATTPTADLMDEATRLEFERQANIFAAYCGAPCALVEHAIRRTFDVVRPFRYAGPGTYCLQLKGGRGRFIEVDTFDGYCRQIAYYIQRWFGGLSKEAIGYRVRKSRLVHNAQPGLSGFMSA